MTSAEPDRPSGVAARPELTGGRRVGVLLGHGFTGVAGLDPAVGPSTSRPRVRRRGATPARARHHLAGPQHADLGRLVRRDRRGPSTSSAVEHDAVVVGGLSMGGALALRLAAEHARPGGGRGRRQPGGGHKPQDVKLLPVLKHLVPSFPGIVNDIKKAGRRRARLRPDAAQGDPQRRSQAWKPLIADLPKVTAPLLYFRSAEDHVVDDASQPIITSRVSSRDIVERQAREQLPRRHPRQRRRADLQGVRRVHRSGDRA